MKRFVAIAAVVICFGAAVFAGGVRWASRSGAARESAPAAIVYTCPMHPDYRSDHPGNCPICHMTLKVVGAAAEGDAAARVV